MSCTRSIAIAACGLALIAGIGCETIYRATIAPGRSVMAPSSSAGLSTSDSAVSTDAAIIPSCTSSGGCLRVLSFNMKHRDVPIQLEAVAKCLRTDVAPLPDFILLQEVVFDRPTTKGHENTAAALADLLQCEVRGTARNGGMEGVAILSRHQFNSYDVRHLKSRDGLFSGGFPRVSVMGEFSLPDIGLIRVVNVHLAQRESVHEVRRQQLQETLEWMGQRQREAPADVVILGGDFNIEPHWGEFSLIHTTAAAGDLKFRDHNSRVPSSGAIGNPLRRVDYIFIAAPQRTIDSIGEAIIWRNGIPTSDGSGRFWPSDHLPLIHAFTIGPDIPGDG